MHLIATKKLLSILNEEPMISPRGNCVLTICKIVRLRLAYIHWGKFEFTDADMMTSKRIAMLNKELMCAML
jgi:hypothetical protein